MALVQSIRVPFLILTPACLFLAVSSVIANQTEIDPLLLGLALLGALCAHISVNTLNEYADFKSGLDLTTTKTPFNGGSGALPQHPEMASAVFALAALSFLATLGIGGFFVWKHGIGIIPIGILGLLLIATYTRWITRHPLLCLIAPGTGMGLLMVVGTGFALEGEYHLTTLLLASIPFFLANNLLLLNQYPDMEADSKVGRYHFPIAYGIKKSNTAYSFFVAATISTVITCVALGYFPLLSLIALLPMPLAFFALRGAVKHGKAIGGFPQYLAANVAVAIITPILLGISIIFG